MIAISAPSIPSTLIHLLASSMPDRAAH
jgi:hypothetical protein